MSDNMQPTDEVLDDEVLDAVDTEELEDVEEFDPFEGPVRRGRQPRGLW